MFVDVPRLPFASKLIVPVALPVVVDTAPAQSTAGSCAQTPAMVHFPARSAAVPHDAGIGAAHLPITTIPVGPDGIPPELDVVDPPDDVEDDAPPEEEEDPELEVDEVDEEEDAAAGSLSSEPQEMSRTKASPERINAFYP